MARSGATQHLRRRVAGPRDADFQKRQKEFNAERAHAIQLGQRADDLFTVNNMVLARRCIWQQVWEHYRKWYRDHGTGGATAAPPFHHPDTFETFRSKCEASPLLSSSWYNESSGDRSKTLEPLLTVGGAVAEMRKEEKVRHWLAHLYRLEVDFLTEKTGRIVVTHRGVCDAVMQRVAGEGGAAETSHALFSLAVSDLRMPLTAELVADACSGIPLFRKVHYEMLGEATRGATAETKGLSKSPRMHAQGSSEMCEVARPMEVDGDDAHAEDA